MSKNDCIFCKIINNKIPSEKVFETDEILAFKDIDSKAPVHVLIVPKKHINTINDITENDKNLLGNMILTAKKIAADKNINESGYRLIFNCNKDGGQLVFHIHMHLLGGRRLGSLG